MDLVFAFNEFFARAQAVAAPLLPLALRQGQVAQR
jgi:hypothetical protein